jgi:1-deoxy-D-xylulose-5-phosphate reductoisomerase
MKRVAILGSTGSIGTQALDIIGRHPGRFRIAAISGGRNEALLVQQVERWKPTIVSVADAEAAARLRAHFGEEHIVLSGTAGLRAVAAESGADIVLAATDGSVAFDAVFAAVDAGIDIAVANKELIVAAGELLFERARVSGARLLPVDSEHSAIFQCLVGEPPERIASIVLTASGGPFWDHTLEQMESATVAEALNHPTWQMGKKNTIDSATMMNKGLEVIEASRFFGVDADRIGVLVHRTSVAHGFAVFTDGNVKAQLAPPDMRLPIGYALAYPDRLPDRQTPTPLAALGAAAGDVRARLDFEPADLVRFPCLALAFEALRAGGTAPAALSAANEIAVDAFLAGSIRFGAIARVVRHALATLPQATLTLEAVRAADRFARQAATEAVEREGHIAAS